MRITPHVAAGVILVVAWTSVPVAGAVADLPPTPLFIRMYDAPSFPHDDTRSAAEEAGRILMEAGFAPEWIWCAAPHAPPRRCTVAIESAELAVRVVRGSHEPRARARAFATTGSSSSAPAWQRPLGYSLVDPRTKSGALATVYLERVIWLANEARVNPNVLLGRAIAHEVGHLLLGSTEHRNVGVMRAIWSREAVRDSHPRNWRFVRDDEEAMRAAVGAHRMRMENRRPTAR
jgi:hypothetical protein